MLQRLHRRVQRVGHVRVGGVHAGQAGAPAGAAGNRLVIGVRAALAGVVATDGDVVHGAAARRSNARRHCLRQRPEHHVDDALRGLHVAAGHGAGKGAVDHRALVGHNPYGHHTAVIERKLLRRQGTNAVIHRRHGDRPVGVHAAAHLRVSAAEIDLYLRVAHPHGHPNVHRFRTNTVVVHHVLKPVVALGNGVDHVPRHAFRVVQQLVAVVPDLGQAVLVDDLLQPALAGAVGGDLGGQVALALARCAHVGQDQAQQVLLHAPVLHDLDRRNANAFLKHLGRQRHRARRHAPHVGVVGAVGREKGRAPVIANENGRHQRNVRQMGAAAVGIVHQHTVAGRHVHVFDGVQHGHRHGAQVHRNVLRLGDHAALTVEQRARKILSLLDVGRKRRAAQRHPHLLGNAAEQVLEHFQANRVVGHLCLHVRGGDTDAAIFRPWHISRMTVEPYVRLHCQ